MRMIPLLLATVLSLVLLPARAQESESAVPLTSQAYARDAMTKGVVLFAVRWDRRWGCGEFENAQLRLIAFDRLPTSRTGDDKNADLVVADAPLVLTRPDYDDYAFIVEPGEYAISGLHIKATASVSDVRTAKVGRDRLIKEGRPEGGSFVVEAGEVVYVGHFYLDCLREPTLWRHYLEDRESFAAYVAMTKRRVPELDISNTRFRLFKTRYFGRDFELK